MTGDPAAERAPAVADGSDTAADAARRLADVAGRVGGSLSLQDTLQAIADAVVDALAFRAAVVNLVRADGRLAVVALSGSAEVHAALEGTSSDREVWDALLAAATPWGSLRFVPHAAADLLLGHEGGFYTYVPDLPVSDDPTRWHPEDALFAPLMDGADLIGVLSVDDPADGMLPGPVQVALLEAFAVQAALAIRNAREHERIVEREQLLQRLFDESPVANALMDVDGRFLRVNRAFCELLGRPAGELVGAVVTDVTHPDEWESVREHAALVRSRPDGLLRVDRRYVHADGSQRWGRLSLMRIGDGPDSSVLAAIEDLTEMRAVQERLQHVALHDALTGLPNRTLVFDRIDQAIVRSKRDGSGVAVIVVDVDHFKHVNDTYGHPSGDRLLVGVADALRSVLRECDTAGRLGGDEFVVVCEGVASPEDAATAAARVHAAVRTPVDLGEVTVLPTGSVGCTVGVGDATADQLVAEADVALYRAKQGGRGRWELFDDAMRERVTTQDELRASLETATRCGQLRLHYQPVVDLATGTTLGFEALLRWAHPERGVLEPADFLDAIIDSDLDLPVQRWVLTTACADLAAARPGDGVAAPFVSVNLSPRQLGRPGLVDDVRAALDRSGLAARRLWLEVTEPVLGDPRHRPVLDRLAALGCRIAVDDFGAAATGLAQLRALPVHVLKLAPEYVAGLGTDRVSAGLVAAIAELAGVLGIQVVGEGVESAEQAALLAASGVALGQGFQLGRPEPGVPGADVETAPRILRAAASSRPGQPFAVVTDSRTSG